MQVLPLSYLAPSIPNIRFHSGSTTAATVAFSNPLKQMAGRHFLSIDELRYVANFWLFILV